MLHFGIEISTLRGHASFGIEISTLPGHASFGIEISPLPGHASFGIEISTLPGHVSFGIEISTLPGHSPSFLPNFSLDVKKKRCRVSYTLNQTLDKFCFALIQASQLTGR